MTLEEATPAMISRLPTVNLLRQASPAVYANFESLTHQTLPLRKAPQRSDDFLTDRHLFDDVVDGYLTLFGERFAMWYQDRFLSGALASLADPVDRLWYRARHYHLYRRSREAESLYRRLIAQDMMGRYRERSTLFLGRLLMRERRWAEAVMVLERFVQDQPEQPWPHFHLGKCYEQLHDADMARQHYQRYQQVGGRKYTIEAARRLAALQPSRT